MFHGRGEEVGFVDVGGLEVVVVMGAGDDDAGGMEAGFEAAGEEAEG